MAKEAELILDSRNDLGEGPVWYGGDFWWVDINAGTLNRLSSNTGAVTEWQVGEKVGAAVPAADGRFVLALTNGLAFLDLETGVLKRICDPESDRPGARFNDGKCDAAGRFWAGTLTGSAGGTSSLYRIDPDLTCTHMVGGIACSNGLAWNEAGDTMYYIDSPTRTIDAFDFELESGAIHNRRVAVDCGDMAGVPDGMTIDCEGMLWVAFYGGACVVRCDPVSGVALETVTVPSPKTTSCCFGGPDFNELYITSAGQGTSPEEREQYPHAGGVFRVSCDVPGCPVVPFAGA
ncbi:MAG: SMP-30/gluconolactonase/LRE family protein [Lentisphaerae bacterium]|jgi:sugar lactone lactonase YvrE|nr:SMP-30/gluconolactonase/LRE family protein [Lentisphaerota bacterium]MBT4818227.1 SMP-30/gluconolactonase/LRE family protein [Lentisphaerota bacterium]MBT5613010.1 SMP-30/gluconolactonase/LRE family protein [Lentisphaerota bacterium]MBT7056744.1 SMP-30/gluconolactonase/LRE family protein [Lentisphaerota bacterium]MBT7843738.1 SMP-30/gluconolactonase/LRE family protein [Lentisphaerota bacterium]